MFLFGSLFDVRRSAFAQRTRTEPEHERGSENAEA